MALDEVISMRRRRTEAVIGDDARADRSRRETLARRHHVLEKLRWLEAQRTIQREALVVELLGERVIEIEPVVRRPVDIHRIRVAEAHVLHAHARSELTRGTNEVR